MALKKTITSSSSTVDCLDQVSVADMKVHCIGEVHVRQKCPTYRPRLAKGVLCRCPDGCPACPPKKPDCSDEVGVMERSRQRTVKRKMTTQSENKECNCAQQKREATKCDEIGEECSWTRWTKWLTGLVSGQPRFSSSTVDCLDQVSVVDMKVHCLGEVHVRQKCPTYRPRLAKGVLCRCPDGCPACPPKKPDCSDEVGVMERSRQRMTKKNMTMQSRDMGCNCDGAQQKREATKCGKEGSWTRWTKWLTGLVGHGSQKCNIHQQQLPKRRTV